MTTRTILLVALAIVGCSSSEPSPKRRNADGPIDKVKGHELKDNREVKKEKNQTEISFDFQPGSYEAGHSQEDALNDALAKSTVTIGLGWDDIDYSSIQKSKRLDALTIERLGELLQEETKTDFATILLYKNFRKADQPNLEAILKLLKKSEFKLVVVQSAWSSGTIIDRVIRN